LARGGGFARRLMPEVDPSERKPVARVLASMLNAEETGGEPERDVAYLLATIVDDHIDFAMSAFQADGKPRGRAAQ